MHGILLLIVVVIAPLLLWMRICFIEQNPIAIVAFLIPKNHVSV